MGDGAYLAGENLETGQAVYLNDADQQWYGVQHEGTTEGMISWQILR